MTIRIALIGFGKIARDEHVPAISADPRFALAAVTSRSGDPGIGVPAFRTLEALLAAMPGQLDAVAICTPPDARHALARQAIDAGLAVLLEKPPAATIGEIADLVAHAASAGQTLYAAWHSQHAAGVQPAARLLNGSTIARLAITWCEDVRKWHPGQDWVWLPGGFGVFDPGINALSIATAILPQRLMVQSARLLIPANRQAPIRAEVAFTQAGHQAVFDWHHSGTETWSVVVQTDAGSTIALHDGGARLVIDGQETVLDERREYPSIYDRFAALVALGQSEVDAEPLRIVADAFLVAQREPASRFEWIAPC